MRQALLFRKSTSPINPQFFLLSTHIRLVVLSYTSPHALQFVFRIPPAKDIARLVPLLKLAMNFIDIVPAIQLSKPALLKSERARALATEEELKKTKAEREEERQKQREEKLQKELDSLRQALLVYSD